MEVLLYNGSHEVNLYEMIRSHIRQVPPYIELKFEEFADIFHTPYHMTDKYWGSFDRTIETYVGVEDGVLVAAAQIAFPHDPHKEWVEILWIFGKAEQSDDISRFYKEIMKLVTDRNFSKVSITKNPFGIAWGGIPDCWPHVLSAVHREGSNETDPWDGYWSDGAINRRSLPSGFSVKITDNMQELKLQFDFYHGEEFAGEIAVWFPSDRAISLTDAGIVDIEWIEVLDKFKGQRLGHAMMTYVHDHCCTLGFRQFMLWTKWDNMRKLAGKLGLKKGPVFHWIRTRISRCDSY